MLARYMLSSCVCPSACPSQVGTVPKRLNIGSLKQHRTIVQGLYSFLMPKVAIKFQRGHAQYGREIDLSLLHSAINNLLDWSCKWQMNVSHNKCAMLQVGTIVSDFSLTTESCEVQKVKSFRDLGVIVE